MGCYQPAGGKTDHLPHAGMRQASHSARQCHAVGLGATVALMCDIIIAADTAKIGDPHVNAGLVAGDGGALIWPQLIGFARAKENLLTGDLMTAAEAERIGVSNHVVSADQLGEKAYGLARRLADAAVRSILLTRQ